jgi:DNA adenine methylase
MIKHNFTSPLRYPGGKGMLTNFAKLLVSLNKINDGDYVEVYAGGASIAWALLFDGYVKKVHINDISKPIYAFWKSVLKYTDELCQLIQDTPVTIEERARQKHVQLNQKEYSVLELGFSTFFLNRSNRAGILKGGVIGGKEQGGKWKLDARFNKIDLIERIQRIASYSAQIRLHNKDAAVFIKDQLPKIPQNSLVYLDPPYYAKGDSLYENFYSHEDHVAIADLVSKINQPWVVSYDNVEPIAKLYKKYKAIEHKLSYSVQDRYAGSEIIFFSKNLLVPDVKDPSRVKMNRAFVPALF